MQKLTLEQAIIVTGYTKKLCCPFSKFHEDAERRLRRPIWTHQFANKILWDELNNAYKEDFIKLCPMEE